MRGASTRDVAKRFRASVPAIQRHASKHLPEALTEAKQAEVVSSATTLLDKIAGYEVTAHRLLQAAESEKDYATALKAIRELVRIVELLAKLQGDLQPEGATVNVLVASPEWSGFKSRLLTALRPYPEAADAVLRAFEAPALAA